MISHLECDTGLLRAFYEPFFLTSFFFAAGYVYKKCDNFKQLIYKKIKQLLVPWFVFSTFNIVLAAIFSFNKHKSLWLELGLNFLQIRIFENSIWFVAALFIAFIPFYFFIKWINAREQNGKKANIVIIISFILMFFSILYQKVVDITIFPWKSNVLPWHLDYIFIFVFFMILGFLFRRKYEDTFDKYNSKKNRICFLLLYILLISCFSLFSLKLPIIILILFQIFNHLLGLIVVISFSKMISINKYISYIGQHTLIYFAFHGKFYSLIQNLLKKFVSDYYIFILENTILSSIFAIIFSLVLSVLLIIPSYIIDKYFPYVIGKN